MIEHVIIQGASRPHYTWDARKTLTLASHTLCDLQMSQIAASDTYLTHQHPFRYH